MFAEKVGFYWQFQHKEGTSWYSETKSEPKRKCFFAGNLIKYLRSSYWIARYINCIKENEVEYNSDTNLGTSNDTDNISDTNFRNNSYEKFQPSCYRSFEYKLLRNKFELLADQVKGNVEILAASETKSEESFPVGQFKIPDYAYPFRIDRNQFGGGIIEKIFHQNSYQSKNYQLRKFI